MLVTWNKNHVLLKKWTFAFCDFSSCLVTNSSFKFFPGEYFYLEPLTEDLTNFKNASMTKFGSHLDTLEGPLP